MRHPGAAELLELHFGETGPVHRARVAAHLGRCTACRALLDEVAWAERLLAAAPDEPPPEATLARVLAAVAPAGTAAGPRQPPAWRAAAPSALAAACAVPAGVAFALGGAPAALALLGAGSLVTLSLAPTLILESRRRTTSAAR